MNVNKRVLILSVLLVSQISFGSECRAVKFPVKIDQKTDDNKLYEYFSHSKKEKLFNYYYYEVLNHNNPKLQSALHSYLLAGNKVEAEKVQLEALQKLGHKLKDQKELCDFVSSIK
jgi:hypothetical protein